MLTDQQLERYARHIILHEVGGQGQSKLLNAKVLVVGAGGLGSPLLMYLAAAGVGTIGIVDNDHVALSNLQRQIIHPTNALDQPKTASAENALNAINPEITINCYPVRLNDQNVDKIMTDYDIVADGCDNFTTRLIVNAACVKHQKTLVSGALSKFDGQVSVFAPHKSRKGDKPLPCYQCFVPSVPNDEATRTCATEGILGVIAGVVGTLQATEVIKEILGLGDSLAGHILMYDGLSSSTRKIALPADPACPICGQK